MPIVVDLLLREVAMLGVLSAVGSGISFLLPADGRLSRIALAPALGLAACGAVMTTATWFMPMDTAAWVVLLPMAIVSVAVAAWAWRRTSPGVDFRAIVALLVIAVVVLGVGNSALVARDSLGPVAYQVFDAGGYVAETAALADHTLSDLADPQAALRETKNGQDLTVLYEAHADAVHQQVGYSATSAAVNRFFGWLPSTTQSAFTIVLILVGGLSGFGAVLAFAPRATWTALVGGLLFAGPLFYQLFLDGSEAALAGLAVLPAFVVVGANALRRLEAWSVVVLAILAGGLVALYPPLVPPVAVAAGLAVVVRALVAARRRELGRGRVGRAALALVGLVVGVAVVAPVALYRAVDYWTTFASNPEAYSVSVLPRYKLPLSVLPGWVLQTREFYGLPTLSGLPLSGWVLSVVIPGVLIAVVAFGVYRFPRALVVIALVGAAALMAWATYTRYDCTYCVQRTLLIVGPMAAIAIAVGLQALWQEPALWWRIAAVVSGVAVLVVVGEKTSVTARRAVDGAFMGTQDLRSLQAAIARAHGPIYLEAIGQGYEAPIEFPTTYEAVHEVSSQRLAVSLESNDYAGLAYVGPPHPPGAEFTPDYRWVLTRAAGIATDRRTVARSGPLALQERTRPLDVVVTSGVAVDTARDDPKGLAWVQGPMAFWVNGPGPRRVWLKLHFVGSGAIGVATPGNARILRRTRSSADVCVPVPLSADSQLRRAKVALADYPPPAAQQASRAFAVRGRPGMLVRLAAMSVSTVDCTGRTTS